MSKKKPPSEHNLLTTERLLKLDRCLDKLDAWLPTRTTPPDFSTTHSAVWQTNDRGISTLTATKPHADISLADLLHIDRTKDKLLKNTAAFVARQPANHALLWGPKGTGKSSLVRALLHHFAHKGLRGIDISVDNLNDLRALMAILSSPENQAYQFMLFIDDLSFESTDHHYKTLKTLIDGSAQRLPENIIIYATSNRRHILKELAHDNYESRVVYRESEPELHHGDSVEEKISLSERFGLWLSFHPVNQSEYLDMIKHWISQLTPQIKWTDETRQQALQWSLERGSRNGRIAKQFVIHLATELHYADHQSL